MNNPAQIGVVYCFYLLFKVFLAGGRSGWKGWGSSGWMGWELYLMMVIALEVCE